MLDRVASWVIAEMVYSFCQQLKIKKSRGPFGRAPDNDDTSGLRQTILGGRGFISLKLAGFQIIQS